VLAETETYILNDFPMSWIIYDSHCSFLVEVENNFF
jgi:hypothetical protein